MANITTVTTAEIREGWDKVQAGKFPLSNRQQRGLGHNVSEWRGSRVDEWVGCSGEQMQTWLHEGYWPEGEDMPNLSGADVIVETPTLDWHEEEGEFDYAACLAREDLYYTHWEDVSQPKGMKIRACFDFNCGTKAETMREYFAWVLKVVEKAETLGIAPDVELFIETQGSFQGHDSRKDMVTIPVVKAGELIDTVAWRAYLTKGGFRTLGFLALGIAGDKLGLSLTMGLGCATGSKWDITYEDETLTIHAPGNANGFPREEMTKKLEDVFSSL